MDGVPGLIIAVLDTCYAFMNYAQLYEVGEWNRRNRESSMK